MKLPFYQVDVFTSVLFGGNPLAVFLDTDELDDAIMQRIAREMNLSETTFVARPLSESAVARVRIFTPGRELPFAGHPTIGTAFVLDRLGKLPSESITFDMAVGSVPVQREGDRYWMTPPPAEPIGGAFDRAADANALGLPTSAVMNPPQLFGGRGVTFLCVLLDTQANVDWVMLERGDLIRTCGEDVGAGNILVFSYLGGVAYARMFADLESNIGEDPATGSAVAPLCAALAQWRVVDTSRTELTIEQGTQMGRQSHLYSRFTIEHTSVQNVHVGGSCVWVFESSLEL
jgi:trans-2,3-dihydro-3-hydroxyanthranilate isomerase